MSARRATLLECDPRWVTAYGEEDAGASYLQFSCPEGHEGCWHTIPFSPALDGRQVHGGRTHWQRLAGSTFATLTLQPSIRRPPIYKDEADAVRQGCKAPIAAHLLCRLHIYITVGRIDFLSDSR